MPQKNTPKSCAHNHKRKIGGAVKNRNKTCGVRKRKKTKAEYQPRSLGVGRASDVLELKINNDNVPGKQEETR